MKNQSQYSATLEREESPCPIICVIDEDGPRSVTNDAENVVAQVVAQYGDHPVIYRDSDGVWDELVHRNGVFHSFHGLGYREPGPAMDQVQKERA